MTQNDDDNRDDLPNMHRWATPERMIFLKLNRIHSSIRKLFRGGGEPTNDGDDGLRDLIVNMGNRIMSEVSDLKAKLTAAIADNKKEVAEAIEKHNEILTKLVEASTSATDLGELKEAVTDAVTELEGTNKNLDEKFETGAFVPSTEP